jgi:serine/threonine protein kinase
MIVGSSAQLCPRCDRAAHPGAACDASVGPVPSGARAFDSFGGPSLAGKRSEGTSLAPGMQIGEYRVEDQIGSGGMGVVYRATAPGTGQSVAIKVLSTAAARSASSVGRFILEVRAVNEIRHPNLVDIFSFGQLTDGRYYYVMEFLEGCSLGALMRARGPLAPAEVLPIFMDVLAALEATHAKGIVHRDLKPDNVFLVPAGPAGGSRGKLLDFGLAKLVEPPAGSPPLTAAGMAVGTPQYMAPEQCKAGKVDGRTDLYALGVMLYEALTGKLPCDGKSTLEIWEAQVRRVPRRPIELAHGITRELDSLVMTLLAKHPGERFASASVTAQALGRLMRNPQRVPHLPRWASAGDPPSPDAILARVSARAPDLVSMLATGASASDVARAIPSSILSTDVIPLGGAAPVAVAAEERAEGARSLRALPDPRLAIVEPALAAGNPNQVSARDIDLGVPGPRPLPAPLAAISPRAVKPIARVARTQRAVGRSLALPLGVAAVVAAALAALLLAR